MSTDTTHTINIPTVEELKASVLFRPPAAVSESTKPVDPFVEFGTKPLLSREAEAFLRDSAVFAHTGSTLEEHFSRVHITSGSIKKRVIQELVGMGLMRLEHKGRSKRVYLYEKAWEYLGMTSPKGYGEGGITHRQYVTKVADLFKKKGFDVRVECPIGSHKKRVDLLALGKQRIAVEIGLSSVTQEIKNIEEDLASGAVDMVVFCAIDEKMLEAVRKRVMDHPTLAGQFHRIRFYLFNLEDSE